MKKAVLLYLCAGILLIMATAGLSSPFRELHVKAHSLRITQGNEIVWTDTDYNATLAQDTYPGPQTISPRITVDYADLVIKDDFASGVPDFQILPRIMLEYTDYALGMNMSRYTGTLPKPWDVNNDGITNIVDVSMVARHFKSKLGDSNWNDWCDVDRNGVVNIVDISIVAKHFMQDP